MWLGCRRNCDYYVSVSLTVIVLCGTLTLWPEEIEPWPDGSYPVIYSPKFNTSIQSQAFPLDPIIYRRLGLQKTNYIQLNDVTTKDLVFVTASGQAGSMMWLKAAIYSIQKYRPLNFIYVYDLGMTRLQQEEVKSLCQVRYRPFNFTAYPRHVRNLMYNAWKPIVIAEVLKFHRGVFWLDGPVSLTTGDFGPLLEQVKETGGGLTLASTGHSNFAATHSDMYKYLPSDSQALRQQRQGTTTMVLYRTEAIVTQVLQWLVLCSLRKDCIAPTKGRPCLNSDNSSLKEYTGCHSYYQSALNVLLLNYVNLDSSKHIARHRVVQTVKDNVRKAKPRKCVRKLI